MQARVGSSPTFGITPSFAHRRWQSPAAMSVFRSARSHQRRRRNVLGQGGRAERLAKRLVSLRGIAREQFAAADDIPARVAECSAGKGKERLTQSRHDGNPGCPGVEPNAIGADSGIELPFGDLEGRGVDVAVARHGIGQLTRHRRAGLVVERVALGDDQSQSSPGVAELPTGVIGVALRGRSREPLDVGFVRLAHQGGDVRRRLPPKVALVTPTSEDRHSSSVLEHGQLPIVRALCHRRHAAEPHAGAHDALGLQKVREVNTVEHVVDALLQQHPDRTNAAGVR